MIYWLVLLFLLGILIYRLSSKRVPKEYPKKQRIQTGSNLAEKSVSQILKTPKSFSTQIEGIQIEITDEFKKAFELMEYTQNHIFVTGKAGTGNLLFCSFLKGIPTKMSLW